MNDLTEGLVTVMAYVRMRNTQNDRVALWDGATRDRQNCDRELWAWCNVEDIANFDELQVRGKEPQKIQLPEWLAERLNLI